MRRGRRSLKELSYRDKKIINRLNSSFDTMSQLAKKHGISKQRIYQILMKAKELGYIVNRPRLSARYHRIDQCGVCNKILQIAKRDDVITKRQLAQLLSIDHEVCNWHLGQLKGAGFVSKRFAAMRSERLVNALQYYRDHSLSPSVVGRKFGYKNFHSLLSYQKKRGVNLERTLDLSITTILDKEDRPTLFPSMSETHS